MNNGNFKKEDFRNGDMILYPYVEDEVLKGRIIKCFETEAEIEICFPGKKLDTNSLEKLKVSYKDIIPFHKGIKTFKTKAQKKAERAARKNNKNNEDNNN